ncbi:MAG TPA: hypothetical protein PK156_23930 [Polyangium sp.]|nr:hypothetical protein [Polyangium sp.]
MSDNQPDLASTAADPTPMRLLSHAERCRTITIAARTGTLSTIAREPAGFPYGSLVTIAVDGRGRPFEHLLFTCEFV